MTTTAPDPADPVPEPPSAAGSRGSGPLPPVVRPALRPELATAGRVVRDAYLADGYDDADYAADLADAETRARHGEVVVAVVAGRVVGGVTFVYTPLAEPTGVGPAGATGAGPEALCEVSGPGEAECRMLGVIPEARGQGIGTELVRWCVERAREVGAARLLLSTCEKMEAGRHIYVKLGFRCVDELAWQTHDGVELLVYGLDLPGPVEPRDPGR